MPVQQPTPTQTVPTPVAKARPGRPISSQADSPLARSLKAATQGPSRRSASR